jgi:hypothetical protein
MIYPGEEIIAGRNEHFRVVDVVIFDEEDESPFVGLLQVEAAWRTVGRCPSPPQPRAGWQQAPRDSAALSPRCRRRCRPRGKDPLVLPHLAAEKRTERTTLAQDMGASASSPLVAFRQEDKSPFVWLLKVEAN